MSAFGFDEFLILPIKYINNPNHFCVIEVYQFLDDFDVAAEYFDRDFNKNFEEHISKNGIKSGNDEIGELLDFRDELYPYCYFFICLDESDLTFMEKQIFKVELFDLLDLDNNEKQEIYYDSIENNCMFVKLSKKLRNLKNFQVPNLSRLREISDKIDFKEMYKIYLEL